MPENTSKADKQAKLTEFSDKMDDVLYGKYRAPYLRERKREIDENKMLRSLGDISKRDYNKKRRNLAFQHLGSRTVGGLRRNLILSLPGTAVGTVGTYKNLSNMRSDLGDFGKYASEIKSISDAKKPSRILHPIEERLFFGGRGARKIRDQRARILALRGQIRQNSLNNGSADEESIARLKDLEDGYKTNYMAGKRSGRANWNIANSGRMLAGGLRTGIRRAKGFPRFDRMGRTFI